MKQKLSYIRSHEIGIDERHSISLETLEAISERKWERLINHLQFLRKNGRYLTDYDFNINSVVIENGKMVLEEDQVTDNWFR